METPDNATFVIPAYSAAKDVQSAPVTTIDVSEVTPVVSKNPSTSDFNYGSLYKELSSISEEVLRCRNAALKTIS